MSSKPLIKNKLFQVKVEKVNDRWVSGMLCGVTCVSPEKMTFPVTALGLKKHSWIICSDWISHNGTKVSRYLHLFYSFILLKKNLNFNGNKN